MGSRFLFGFIFSAFLVLGFFVFGSQNNPHSDISSAPVHKVLGITIQNEVSPTHIPLKPVPSVYSLPQSEFVSQTYNNCGPATLSMVLSMFGKHVSQDELASKMRPFNNPYGGEDDKSVFADEFVRYAKQYGFEAVERPNGNRETLKKFVANGIPVVVRTMLNDHEDIGHFRIVRGYDDKQGVLIQDDSYQGPGLEYSYDSFDQLWQPFNYGYIVVYPAGKQQIVDQILGGEKDSVVAYQHSIERAEHELAENPNSVYSTFNIATAYFYLGDYQKSKEAYEKVAGQLPPRMFWYQTEPIQNYLALTDYDRVIELSDQTLESGNAAYSEMYFYKAQAYEGEGNTDLAKQELQRALYYNQNYLAAQKELSRLN